jgi:threonine dehydrogenase-like Zn-dependent dehydrogenase
MPWLALRRYEPRPLPGPQWLRVRPVLAGICGTDLALLTGRLSAAMSPFASFPAVLGHEVVGTVSERGPEVDGVDVGDRVTVDPVIGCLVRGLPPCDECVDGHPATCRRVADGPFSAGLLLGYCRDLPGAWGDEMLVHRSQAYRVPDALDDATAVLVEPLAVALHAVLRRVPADHERVLLIGGGPIGLLVSAALRLVGAGCTVVALARHPRQRAFARRLGAADVVSDEEAAAAAIGARSHRDLLGGRSYRDGYEVVFDCVGDRESLDLAARLAGPRGRVVLAGGPGIVGPVDLTPTWVGELSVEGTYASGREPTFEGGPSTFAVALRLLEARAELRLGELVTHRFALESWRRAIAANLDRRRSGAIRTVFDLAR